MTAAARRSGPVRLELPLPPSPNELRAAAFSHPQQATRLRNRWRREAWAHACSGDYPPVSDPPSPVLLRATYIVASGGWRDPDNRTAGLKLPIDLIKKPRGSSAPAWRGGLYETKGWIVDDDDRHLVLDGAPARIPAESSRAERLLLDLIPVPRKEEEDDAG